MCTRQVIGSWVLRKPSTSLLLVSGRASFELVQKADGRNSRDGRRGRAFQPGGGHRGTVGHDADWSGCAFPLALRPPVCPRHRAARHPRAGTPICRGDRNPPRRAALRCLRRYFARAGERPADLRRELDVVGRQCRARSFVAAAQRPRLSDQSPPPRRRRCRRSGGPWTECAKYPRSFLRNAGSRRPVRSRSQEFAW